MKLSASLLTGWFLLLAQQGMVVEATNSTNATQPVKDDDGPSQGLRGAQVIDPGEGRRLASCGWGNRGDGGCADGSCCSQYGWCGWSDAHCAGSSSSSGTCGGGNRGDGICSDGSCCSQYGWCGTSSAHCAGSSSSSGTCGGGNRGDGICSDGSCCSQYGWCGTSSAHCSGGGGGSGGSGGTNGVSSPAKVLTRSDLQSALDVYNSFWGSGVRADQGRVDQLNAVTTVSNRGWTLYRQVAFVAQTIWESGGYEHTEEVAGVNGQTNYVTSGCDRPGKSYYGRGYIQLTWCYNYRTYSEGRMYNNNPNYFVENPELVATSQFAMDSAAWIFENRVPDTSGQFGLTTNEINGAIECRRSSNQSVRRNAQRRYQIFEALARQVGLTGYSEAGCY